MLPRFPWRLALLAWIGFWVILACGLFLGYDQINYQAAAERLNAGHALYSLGPGDRLVTINPPFWYSPLLYPPLIAVLWRPIVLVPFGAAIWWLVNAGAMLATTAHVARRSPLVVALAGVGVGITVASGNVGCLLVAGMVASWRWRDRPEVGVLVATMVAVKLIPATLVFWLLATRRWQALGWFMAASAGLFVVTVIGAGAANALAYVDVLRTPAVPVPLSLSGLTGIPPWTAVALGAVAILLLHRNDARAFQLAVILTILGSPFVGVATLASLLPLGALSVRTPSNSRNNGGGIGHVDDAPGRRST
ncbi:MAG: DUF2029 domain-containing protein [Chloroflexi bacterium]|nr:DUF2029 domain-containing protein [Chloroflexota bacterium]